MALSNLDQDVGQLLADSQGLQQGMARFLHVVRHDQVRAARGCCRGTVLV